MNILGAYVSVVDLLVIFCGFLSVCIILVALELNRLKVLEKKFEKVERLMQKEEKEIEGDIRRLARKRK